MSIKDQIIYKAFREVNGFKAITEANDTYVKFPTHIKTMIHKGVPVHSLAKRPQNELRKLGS